MGQFDQTARPLAKMEKGTFLDWAFACCEPRPGLTWLAWDDTRRLVCPGEPERTNDLVALCRDEAAPTRPCWFVVEIEEEPELSILYRMGQYELLLGKEVNPIRCRPGRRHHRRSAPRNEARSLNSLERPMARESHYINGWIAVGERRGRLKAARESILTAIEIRIADPVPDAIRHLIEQATDEATLDQWLDAALSVHTIADLRREMQPEP